MVHLTIVETTWLLLPAGVANTMPVIAALYNWLPLLNRPLDLKKRVRSRRLFGDNKTWRGLVVGLFFGSSMGYIQHLLYTFDGVKEISRVSYSSPTFAIGFGALLAVGALGGDAAKSFFKRQRAVAPGKPWHPFDQIDFVIGALFVSWLFVSLTVAHVAVALLLFGIGSHLSSFIGVKLKIKKSL